MCKRKYESDARGRRRFRIFASSEDYWVADIWAVNEADANKQADDLAPGSYHGIGSEWQVDSVQEVEPSDGNPEPIRPAN